MQNKNKIVQKKEKVPGSKKTFSPAFNFFFFLRGKGAVEREGERES